MLLISLNPRAAIPPISWQIINTSFIMLKMAPTEHLDGDHFYDLEVQLIFAFNMKL